MVDVKSILALIQLPVIALTAYFCYTAYKGHKLETLRYISYAWAVNLLYAILITIDKGGGYSISRSSDMYYDLVVIFLDLLMAYLLMLGSRSSYKKIDFINRIVPRDKWVLSYLYLVCISLFICSVFWPKLLFLSNILYCWLLFISMYVFFHYSIALSKRYKLKSILIIGVFVYLCIQLFPLLIYLFPGAESTLNSVGFSIGLISKALICLGFHFLLMKLVGSLKMNDEFLLRLQKNIDRVMHELQKPGDNLYDGISTLIADPERYRLTSSTVNVLKTFEESVEHINVVIASARKMIYEPEVLNFAVQRIDKEYKDINFNVIVKTSVNIIKNSLREKKGSSPKIEESYTSQPIVYCNFSDILQLSLNLLKNSIESIAKSERKEKKGIVYISTRKDNKNKVLTLRVDDNGIGVPEAIKDRIFDEGFSTKPDSEPIRGYGLTIVKEIVDFYKGEIEIFNNLEDNMTRQSGATVVVKLPYNSEKMQLQ